MSQHICSPVFLIIIETIRSVFPRTEQIDEGGNLKEPCSFLSPHPRLWEGQGEFEDSVFVSSHVVRDPMIHALPFTQSRNPATCERWLEPTKCVLRNHEGVPRDLNNLLTLLKVPTDQSANECLVCAWGGNEGMREREVTDSVVESCNSCARNSVSLA